MLFCLESFGGIFKTPAYMVKLKPQLKADGNILAEGKPVGLGYKQEFTISMGQTGLENENLVNPVTAGGYYAVGLDYGKIDTVELKSIQDRLMTMKDKVTDKDIYTDNVMGEMLNALTKAYFGQVDGFGSIMGSAFKIRTVKQICEVMTAYNPNVKYMFMTPVEFSEGSYYIDVDRYVSGVASLEGKRQNEIGYMMCHGVISSAMEHGIFEQIFQIPSVSTIKILNEASRRGIPIYSFNKSNISRIKEITASNAVKTDVVNAVNSGKVVIIPKEEIRYYDWKGSGYIILNPETGAAGYMISGNLAGAMLSLDVDTGILALSSIVFAYIDCITLTLAICAATNPVAALLLTTLFALNYASIIKTICDVVKYMETGDPKYLEELERDALCNLTFGAISVLSKVIPLAMKLYRTVFSSLDGPTRLLAENMDPDVVNNIFKTNGTTSGALTYANQLIGEFKNLGIDEGLIYKISNTQGVEGLASLKQLLKSEKVTIGIVEELVKKGFYLEDIRYILGNGIEVADFAKYGIENGTEAKCFIDFIKNGYRKDVIEALGKSGVSPSGMSMVIDAATEIFKLSDETLSVLRGGSKTIHEAMWEHVNKLRTLKGLPEPFAFELGNMGSAWAKIEEEMDEVFSAFSRYDNEAGFVILRENRLFKTLKVNNQQIVDGVGAFDRAVDTESKILEEIAARLGNNTGVRGTINLYIERAVCPSCEYVIQQFLQGFPNVIINLIKGKS